MWKIREAKMKTGKTNNQIKQIIKTSFFIRRSTAGDFASDVSRNFATVNIRWAELTSGDTCLKPITIPH